jgi:hypothetical protein
MHRQFYESPLEIGDIVLLFDERTVKIVSLRFDEYKNEYCYGVEVTANLTDYIYESDVFRSL